MSLKLYMSKAYDRVKWHFLEMVMAKMGLSERMTKLIINCVRSVSFSILVNGENPFVPSWGLRQGEPLFPYLFLLCTEGLIKLFTKAERKKEITGIKVCRKAPIVTHLLFPDDSVIFCKRDVQENERVQALLHKYEMVSGQMLNKDKTSLTFSKNTPLRHKGDLGFVGISNRAPTRKILRFPTYCG